MAQRRSAGLLLYRRSHGVLEVMLVHMGGPFWTRKDAHAWSIPKGEYADPESPLDAARREFAEETGIAPPEGAVLDLGVLRQPRGKLIHAFALEADIDVSALTSNTFELEWPRGSGRVREFPEVDRAGWFDLQVASEKLVKGQVPFLAELEAVLGQGPRDHV